MARRHVATAVADVTAETGATAVADVTAETDVTAVADVTAETDVTAVVGATVLTDVTAHAHREVRLGSLSVEGTLQAGPQAGEPEIRPSRLPGASVRLSRT